MNEIENFESQYENLIRNISSFKEAAKNKELAKLGDSIINMTYSIAYSIFIGKPIGEKVSAIILSESMKKADLRKYAKRRAKAHDIADAAESIIAYFFLKRKISIEQIILKIFEGLKSQFYPIKTIQDRRDIDIASITNLLVYIRDNLIF